MISSRLILYYLSACVLAIANSMFTNALRMRMSLQHMAGATTWTPATPGEVRCFCNLPLCVTSGYMCKSPQGGCFSDLFDFQDVYKARHGCVELLESDQQGQCQNAPGSSRGRPRSLLLCCRSDMCNHVDSPEIKLRLVNDTFLNHVLNTSDRTATNHNNHEVWFKAATIAVPICGALILFLLIALAIKILRKDITANTKSPNVYPVHQDKYYADIAKKVPLLHSVDVNATNKNENFSTLECITRQHCKLNDTNYRDISVHNLAPIKSTAQKQYGNHPLAYCPKSVVVPLHKV